MINNGHDYSYMEKDYNTDPVNKGDYYIPPTINDVTPPCDGCPFNKKCEVSGKECTAFKWWCEDGKAFPPSLVGQGI